MGMLFSDYAKETGGWIDVNKLSYSKDVPIFRQIASAIVGKETVCRNPKVTLKEGGKKIPTSDDLQYCMWNRDTVSKLALNDFGYEPNNWGWVARSFDELKEIQKDFDSGDKGKCSWGYLDIGVNVGDWISPLRLLLPSVPIYGIEGSPGTAAIATANLRTSIEHHVKEKTSVATSYLLPYSLMAEAQYSTIQRNGGVCFSEISRGRNINIGGRGVTEKMDCPVSDAAGATTLNHAMQHAPLGGECSRISEYPLIYIAKIDVEGSEFRALSSIVSWWSQQPPCYVIMEYWWKRTAYISVAELLVDFGYDRLWIPKFGSYPPDTPLWDKESGELLPKVVLQAFVEHKQKYTEIVFGFSDIKACLSR